MAMAETSHFMGLESIRAIRYDIAYVKKGKYEMYKKASHIKMSNCHIWLGKSSFYGFDAKKSYQKF